MESLHSLTGISANKKRTLVLTPDSVNLLSDTLGTVSGEMLDTDLMQLAGLLRKYEHCGQATVVEQIITTLDESQPDYKRLAGIDMWGGSGAVWEVSLTSSRASSEAQVDKKSFDQTIIRIASEMDRLGIGTERSRSIAKILQERLDKDIV
jgi:hypothetical protein